MLSSEFDYKVQIMLDVECPVDIDIINSYLRVIIVDLIEVHVTVSQRILLSTYFLLVWPKLYLNYFHENEICALFCASHPFPHTFFLLEIYNHEGRLLYLI